MWLQVSSKPCRKQPAPMPKGEEMLTSPQLEGQRLAMEAADGIYSIPPSPPGAADAADGMAAKHARANAMAQTITLLELMIKPISLSVRGVRCRDYILGYRNYFIFKSYRDTVSCLRRYRIKPSRAKILTRHNSTVPSGGTGWYDRERLDSGL